MDKVEAKDVVGMDSKRIFFLDNLRWTIVCLMIIYHIIRCYEVSDALWYVKDEQSASFFFTCLSDSIDMFQMPILFFIVGYFGVATLRRYGGKKWWKGKFVRIVLPCILGVGLLSAPTAYLILYTKGSEIRYLDYFWTMFLYNGETGGAGPFWSHTQYWYLDVLILLFACLWLVSKVFKDILKRNSSAGIPGKGFFFLLFLLMLAGVEGMLLYIGRDSLWVSVSYVLTIRPSRILVYLMSFFLGVYAWRSRWFTEGGYVPGLSWVAAFAASLGLRLLWKIYETGHAFDGVFFLLLNGLTHTMVWMTAIFGLTAFFKRKLDYTNRFLGGMAENSYTMYWINMPLVLWFVVLLLPYSCSVWVKAAASCSMGIAACYFVGKLFLYLPFFKAGRKAKAV